MKILYSILLVFIVAGGLWAEETVTAPTTQPRQSTNVFDLNAFADSTKYGWQDLEGRNDFRQDLMERQKLLHLYEMDSQTVSANVVKSAIFPGWGQFSTKHNTKGTVLLGIELALWGSALYYYDKSNDYYRKYQLATQVAEIEDYYKKAQDPYQFSMIILGFSSVVWAYNLFDVIQSTESYNASVWDTIIKDYYDKPVKLTPQGVEIRF